jgi:glycosyltransferase involved in cell wall biosynthesis
LDLQQFNPEERLKAREALGLNPAAILIGFGAADVQAPRKGLQHLLNALRRIKTSESRETESIAPIECVIFGSGERIPCADLPKLHHFGFLDSPERQRLIYSAVDFVVVPSREDNQPQVGLEAMACGSPVVAFDSGGLSEYVLDGETGLLAPLGDEPALADRILKMAKSSELRHRLSSHSRRLIERHFDVRKQSERYLELYQSLVQTKTNALGSRAA